MSGLSRLTLMPIFAHPDDESFVGTGALIKYARAGVRVVLLCATRGERGKAGDPPVCTPTELPQVREQELRDACAVLGIEELRFLDYIDKELPNADETEAVGKIVAAIREFRPQVLYTFPPDGHSGHVDHLAINRLAGLAFRAAGDPQAHPRAGAPWQPARLFWHLRQGTSPEPVHAVIETADTIETRVAALKCHRTQHLSIERVFQNYDSDFLKQWASKDHFHLADSAVERPAGVIADLFEGVR